MIQIKDIDTNITDLSVEEQSKVYGGSIFGALGGAIGSLGGSIGSIGGTIGGSIGGIRPSGGGGSFGSIGGTIGSFIGGAIRGIRF